MRKYRWALSAALIWFAATAVLGQCAVGSASAADKLRIGKSVPFAWSFTPIEVGIETGIFAKYGLSLDVISFGGDAKLQQGLASDSVDIGLGSGPAMGFVAKGAPVIAVAAFAGPPRNISVVVPYDSPFKSVADLKGKTFGVTTVGSLTDWLAKRMAVKEGWGVDGVKTVALGGLAPSVAALRTHQVDGLILATEAGYMLEEKKEARNLFDLSRYAPHFHTHVFFARKALVADHPDQVERFLKGWFATIAFMKAHKQKTVEITASVLHQSPAAMAKTYDKEISMMLDDGRFDPRAIETLKQSFVDMGILDKRPTDDQLFTTRFVPVKP